MKHSIKTFGPIESGAVLDSSVSSRWLPAFCAITLAAAWFAPLASGQGFILDWNDPGWTNATTGNPSEFLTEPKDGAGWSDVHQLIDAGGTGIDITLTLSHQPNQWNIEERPSLAPYFPSPNGTNGDILRSWNQNHGSGVIPAFTMEFSQDVTISRFGFEGMRSDDAWRVTAYDEAGSLVEPNWSAAELAAPPTETTVGDALAAVPINLLRGGVEADSTARYDSGAKAFFMWNKNNVFDRAAGVIDYNGVGARRVLFEMIEVNTTDGTPTGYGSDTSIYLAGGFSIIPGNPEDPPEPPTPPDPERLYYTYNFSNEGSAPAQAALFDGLPDNVVWDSTYTPVTTGSLEVDVVYSNGDKEATIDPLELPPGDSSLTLATRDVPAGGNIENTATLTLANGETFEPEGGGTTIELPAVEFDTQIAVSSDDADEKLVDAPVGGPGAAGTVRLDLPHLNLAARDVGLRFAVALPVNATISNAYVQFTCSQVFNGTATTIISGQSADDAPTFGSVSHSISTRPKTDASVTWDIPAGWVVGESEPAQRSPDISAIIQEVIDRPGWTGSSVVLIFADGPGTGKRKAYTFDNNPSAAPVLHLEFQ